MKASYFQSKQWKNIIAKLYGFGAALVILGALFKLQHWNYAGIMLSVGMITEFIIFIFSAFDPPPSEYHWGRVYPELLDDEMDDTVKANLTATARRQPVVTGVQLSGLNIDPSVSEDLKQSMEKFTATLNGLNALSAVAEASGNLAGGVQQAATNMSAFNQSVNTAQQTMQSLNNAYQQTSQVMLDGGKQAGVNMEALNKHLSAVNASYELYIQEHKQYVASANDLLETMKQSADHSRQFSTQMDKLNHQIGDLNSIYGSMISTVNAALKR